MRSEQLVFLSKQNLKIGPAPDNGGDFHHPPYMKIVISVLYTYTTYNSKIIICTEEPAVLYLLLSCCGAVLISSLRAPLG